MKKKQLLVFILAFGLAAPAIALTSMDCQAVSNRMISQANKQRQNGEISLIDFLAVYQMARDYLNDCLARVQELE